MTETARQIPLIFGGMSAPAYARMAHWGEGYVGASVPANMVSEAFDGARTAWKNEGRDGGPRLIAIAYFAVSDEEQGRANVYDYYSTAGDDLAKFISGTFPSGAEEIRKTVASFADLGADELILHPTTGNLDDISQLAGIVL